MSKHYLFQKQNGIIIKKTVKDWAREPQNQKKFPKYSFQRPYNTDTTPTSEEIDAQLQREGCKREVFNGDYYCYDPTDISKNDLIMENYMGNILINISKTNNALTNKLDVENEKSIVTTNDTNNLNLIEKIKHYIENNSVPLFNTLDKNSLSAVFDDKGFFLSSEAQEKYKKIFDEPHLYIAYIKNKKGTTYIGKSFQKGGRWKRSHAYHLGTLAHHLNNTIRYDDQNHGHWIEAWMDNNSIITNRDKKTIYLYSEVLISFIPFGIYSNIDWRSLEKQQIKAINHEVENQMIRAFSNVGLLNIQGK